MTWWFQGTISEIWQVAAYWVTPPIRPLYRSAFAGEPRLLQREDVPGKATFNSKRKQLPDVVLVESWPLVSQRLYQKMESLEPGRHQFFPVEISRASGKEIIGPDGEIHQPADQPYYLFNITDRVDAIDLVRSDVNQDVTIIEPNVNLHRRYVSTKYVAKIAFQPELIAGRHLWEGIMHCPGKPFISDELGAWIIGNKMKGIELEPTKWLGEGPAPKLYRW
jgi:hypothetical protein